jgi:predicted acetyltransferase
MTAELIAPDIRVHASFLAGMDEFIAEGRGGADDHSAIGAEIRRYRDRWSDPRVFAGYVAELRAQSLPSTPRPAGFVACTTFWYADGTEYLGRVAVRHALTAALRVRGGHIGYDVRPAARRRGYATAMLRGVLPVARDLGIAEAMVTCDDANVASIRVIEANGGRLDAVTDGCRTYWIPLDGTGSPGLS